MTRLSLAVWLLQVIRSLYNSVNWESNRENKSTISIGWDDYEKTLGALELLNKLLLMLWNSNDSGSCSKYFPKWTSQFSHEVHIPYNVQEYLQSSPWLRRWQAWILLMVINIYQLTNMDVLHYLFLLIFS